MKKRVLKYIMLGIVVLALACVILLRLNPEPIRSINNILIDDDVEFYENNEGYYEAAKKGHLIKINEKIESKNRTWNIENVLYDSRTVIIKVTTEDGDHDEYLELDLKGADGEKLTLGPFIRTDMYKGKWILVYEFDLRNESIKDDAIRLYIDEESKEKEEKYIEIKLDRKILDKEPKIYNVDKTIEVEGVSAYIDKLEAYPLSLRMAVSPITSNEHYSYDGMSAKITSKNHNEKNQSTCSYHLDNKGNRIMIFKSDYYKNKGEKNIEIDEVYFKRKEKCNFIIDIENNIMKYDLDYKFKLKGVNKDSLGNVTEFAIKSDDEKILLNFIGIREVKIDGEEVSVGHTTSSVGLTEAEECTYTCKLREPIKGEKITFDFGGVVENREVDVEIKIHLEK